jgi:Ca2+-binding EF-hand superfamily protein
MQAIFREIDFNESGVIDFGEFVCVMTDKKELFTVGNIEELFAMIDTMEDGVIRKTELNNFLVRFGHSDKR